MILVPAVATALIGTISIRLVWGLLSASPDTIHHYGPHGHGQPGILQSLLDGRPVFFGPRESMALIILILLITVIISILVTNRFLTSFVFRHIREPLDILSEGVDQIGQGHLDHRILYDEPDEFAPVCQAFNGMADRLKSSVEQTKRNEENRRLLLAGISHDLRSPLTSIRAYTEGLLDGVADSEEVRRQYLSTIQRKTDEIDRLVSQVFTYSKLDLSTTGESDARFSPDREILLFLKEQSAEYASRGLLLDAHLVPVWVPGDKALFHRILSNLCENSQKYRTKDPGHMTLSLEVSEARCLFTAWDDGPGVSEEELPRLFDVFYRGDKARRDPSGGSGLGLSIVSRCAEQLNGSIWAEHAASDGLAIRISLPLWEGNIDEEDINHRR
jgi:signal transduction histidine kinase